MRYTLPLFAHALMAYWLTVGVCVCCVALGFYYLGRRS